MCAQIELMRCTKPGCTGTHARLLTLLYFVCLSIFGLVVFLSFSIFASVIFLCLSHSVIFYVRLFLFFSNSIFSHCPLSLLFFLSSSSSLCVSFSSVMLFLFSLIQIKQSHDVSLALICLGSARTCS